MSVLQVLHIPDERLRKVAKPVEEVNAEIQRIVDDMFETMYAEEGIGLAATQVDIHQRIIVIDVFISQVEKDNTQALIPTMNMARQLSEASAWELFAAQNLTSADNEKMWQAQGRMLTAQSLKINALLQALREQGFDTTAIEQQEQEISRYSHCTPR